MRIPWRALALCALTLVAHEAAAQTVEYVHTDLLGSPVAMTDANGEVISRTEYAPYGEQVNRPVEDGLGFTGHVADATSGLTYMQQRYYHPGIGRFLSVDPVTAYDNGDMRHFSRYAYAFNNPYSFTDPDGRAPGDNWYGYNDQRLRDWVHGEKQAQGRRGAQNYTKRDLERLHREWKDLGEPRGKGGTSGRGGSQRGFFVPSWLLKLNVVLSLVTYSSDLNAGEQEAIDNRRQEAEAAQGNPSGRSGSNDGGSTSIKGLGGSGIKGGTYDSKTGEAKVRLEPETGSRISREVTVCADKSKCGG